MNKNLIIISVGRVSQMVVIFLTYRVLSTVLSVADMGVYYFLLSIAGAFGLIYANPIGMYANRMLHAWRDHHSLMSNIKKIILSFLLGSLLTIPILFLFKDKLSYDVNGWVLSSAVLVTYVFSTSINGTLVPSLNILGFTYPFVILTVLTNIVGLLLSYLLVLKLSFHPLAWLLGQGISFTFFGILAYVYLKKNIQESLVSKQLSENQTNWKTFALPIVVTNVAVWVLAQSFRFFYKDNVNAEVLGELAFGLGLASSLSVAVEYLFQQLYLPAFYEKINKAGVHKGEVWNAFINKLLPYYVYLLFYLIGLSPFLLRVLADIKFKNSANFLALGAIVEFFRMSGNIFNMATQSEMKTHKAIAPYLFGGALTLVSVLFISYHPEFVSYTPFALMAGYLGSMLYLHINVKKLFQVNLDLKSFFKSICLSLIFLTGYFLKDFSPSLSYSIVICFCYGLIILYLFYKNHTERSL